jgi:GNAT superfamily N-acetyltransferase
MKDEEHRIEPMSAEHIEEAVSLVSRAMNPSEGRWARKTMQYHFNCLDHAIDDGRSYYVWRQSGRLCGLVGLHHYLWGPEQNVWLSWFAVEPDLQRQGHGAALLAAIERVALQQGYRRFLIETYDHGDFDKAQAFYLAQGFAQVGRISDYIGDGSDMVIYRKDLAAE